MKRRSSTSVSGQVCGKLHLRRAGLKIFLSAMLKFFALKSLQIRVCAGLLGLFCLVSCQTGRTDPNLDPATEQFLGRITPALAAGRKISPEDFERLREIYRKYPQADPIRRAYQTALVRREDWGTLEEFLTRQKSGLSAEENRLLAKVYVKLGKFRQALEILQPLIETDPEDVEIRGLAGISLFNLGEQEAAGRHFDSVWERLIAEKKIEEIALRGIIYYRRDRLPEAVRTLETALEIDPGHIPSLNTLSRIYARRGDAERARLYSEKTSARQKEIRRETFEKSRRVGQIYELERAWADKNYREVIELANKLLPATSDKKEKMVLYQYLFNTYRALGRTSEAEEVADQVRKLQRQQ